MSSDRGKKRPLTGNVLITQFMGSNKIESKRNDNNATCVSVNKKPKRERCSGFDSKWKIDFPWVKEVDGGKF